MTPSTVTETLAPFRLRGSPGAALDCKPETVVALARPDPVMTNKVPGPMP